MGRVLVEPYPVLTIAEEEIRNAKMNKTQLAAMPLPSHIESALQKHRRKNVPPLPLSLDFQIPLLYQRTWSGEQFVLADVQRKRFCDGTFKTRPLLFEQVYIIQCLVGEQVLPAVYALTSNRKRKTYEEMIDFILNLAANRQKVLSVQRIISDYEEAWLLAVEKMLPTVSRLGCWFHFTQACYRNIQKLGLSSLYDDDSDIRLMLRKFLALALLSQDQIKTCFKQLCKNIDPRLQSFIEYFKQQWMIDMRPHLWCVADSPIRTNNSSEGNKCGSTATRAKRAKQAVKKTYQIIKLHRLFIENKKTLEQLILGLSFLVGEPVGKNGLVSKCLDSVPQYRQAYPAPRADASQSLEQMIARGFPPNQNILWHKKTHGQKRYYWIRKPNGDEEVRVKVGGGVFGKADRDLRILTSINECQKIVRQFLVRWDKNGSLPGWKAMWSIFDVANYDVSERRIKVIHKIIQDCVTREPVSGDNIEGSDNESISDRLPIESHSDIHNQDNGSILQSSQTDDSCSVQQPSLSNQVHRDQTGIKSPPGLRQFPSSIIVSLTTNQAKEADNITLTNRTLPQHTTMVMAAIPAMTPVDILSPPQYEQSDTNNSIGSDDSDKENDVGHQALVVGQAQQTPPNSLTTSQPSSSTADYETQSSAQIPTPAAIKKKRQRRVYAPRATPYATRQRGPLTFKETK
ncbi:unnamed protein product [Rotaria sp. Silwood1]|nr:unnamed protein product [Rotaria sp. Silwood1]CAF1400119.1 unnamed protein product [Rotaria sp. Silwood1]